MKKKFIAAAIALIMTIESVNVMAFAGTNSAMTSSDGTTSLTGSNVPSPKEEVIYANIDSDGTACDMYVVNILEPFNGKILDYGKYESVRNMNTTEEVKFDGNKITATTDADKLYIEGKLNQDQIPWKITTSYLLDGEKLTADEIAGKSGHLVILLNVSKNNKFDDSFYKNYTVQANVTLDSDKCKNITSENATMANVGSDKQLTFTMLPGKGGRQRIDTDVTDFEMDEISINCVNMNLNIEIDSDKFDEDTQELKDGVVDLDDGVKELRDTVDDKLVGAVSDLQDASDKIKDGTSDLKEGTSKFKNGVQDFEDGINQVYNGSVELEVGAKALDAQSDTLNSGASSLTSGLKSLAAQMPALQPYLQQLITGAATLEVGLNAYTGYVGELSDGTTSLRQGVSELRDGAYSLYDGVTELDDGANEFDEKIVDLQDGVDELADGVSDLQDGIKELKDGTKELRDGTDDIDEKIDEKIDETVNEIKGNGKVISFVSPKNTNVKAVQFVLKTEAVKMAEVDDPEPEEEIEKGFWEKVLDLFGFIKAEAAETKDYALNSCWWENDGAVVKGVWDKPANASSYDVTLYYGGTDSSDIVCDTTALDTSYDFAKAIASKGPGIYYFRVYPKKLGKSAGIYSDALEVGYEIYKAVADVYGSADKFKETASVKKTRVATPDGFYITGDNKLKWNAVSGCSGYRVIIFADGSVDAYKRVDSPAYDIDKYMEGEYGTVEIKVSAFPVDTINYRQSSYYSIDDLEAFAIDNKIPGKWVNSATGLKFRDEDGEYVTGFREITGDTYYFNDRNVAVKGWVQDEDGLWYYFGDDYKMVTGDVTIDGVTYRINDGSDWNYPTGAWIESE